MAFEIKVKKSFQKDFDRILRQGHSIAIIQEVIARLQSGVRLEPKYKDHKLRGDYKDFRECHIKPDLLLIYQIDGQFLYLVRIGSHSDLF